MKEQLRMVAIIVGAVVAAFIVSLFLPTGFEGLK